MVGATNRSMAAMSGAWLRRKVRHPWDGGPHRLTMYLATLDWATSKPSLSSSPWMRGAPHSGFSTLIRRISARRSASICGRPPRERDFQRQYRRKPARCQRTRVSGRMIVIALKTDGNHRYSWTKNKRSLFVNWTRPRTFRRSTDQLMSEYSVLCLKSALRLERRGDSVSTKQNSAIIAADVNKFAHTINKDLVHTATALLALALTFATSPAAAQQSQQQWTPEQRAACEPDATW